MELRRTWGTCTSPTHLAPSSRKRVQRGMERGSAEERPFTARAASPPTSAERGRALVVLPDLDSHSSRHLRWFLTAELQGPQEVGWMLRGLGGSDMGVTGAIVVG